MLATAIAACLLASAGCGAPPEPRPPTVPIEQFTAVYERSGGLKPMAQKVAIKAHRRTSVTATRWSSSGMDESAPFPFTLPLRRAKQFRAALSQPQFANFESSPAGSCADCYVYSIAFRGHTITFPQSEIPIWIRTTVQRFEALVESHLPRH